MTVHIKDIDHEYNNVRSWSTQNKLSINNDKTKEIIFHRPAARKLFCQELKELNKQRYLELV